MTFQAARLTLRLSVRLGLQFHAKEASEGLHTICDRVLGCVKDLKRVRLTCITLNVDRFRHLMVLGRTSDQAASFLQEVNARIVRRHLSFLNAALAKFRRIRNNFLERSVFCVSFRRCIVRYLTLIFNPDASFNRRETNEGHIFVASGIFNRRTVTFFAAASVLLLAFARASFTNGPLRTNMTITRFGLILIYRDLSRFNNRSNLRSRIIQLRLARYGAILSSMMRRSRADLIAVSGRPLTLVILTNRASAINVQIAYRCSIDIGLLDRHGNRKGNFNVFKVQEGRYQRVTILRRLFKRTISVLGSPLLR